MRTGFVVLLIFTAAWMMITTTGPDVVTGANEMLTPHRTIRLVAIGIVAGLLATLYLRRRRS